MITPPTVKGGITVKVGGKTVAGPMDGMTTMIKATNSIGATTNSIAIIVQKMNESFATQMQMQIQQQQELADAREEGVQRLIDQRREEQDDINRKKDKQDDLDAENKQENQGTSLSYKAGAMVGAVSNAFGFFEGIARFLGNVFKTIVSYAILKWIANPENTKKVKKMIEGVANIGKFLLKVAGWIVNMGLGGLGDFMENPLSFKGIFGIVKFITALGLFFAPAKMAKLGLKAVMSLFKGGKLFKIIGDMMKNLMKVFKGIVAFCAARPRAALILGGAILATWGLKALLDKDEEAAGDELEKDDKEQKNNDKKNWLGSLFGGNKDDKKEETPEKGSEESYDQWRRNYDASDTTINGLKEGDEGFEDALKKSWLGEQQNQIEGNSARITGKEAEGLEFDDGTEGKPEMAKGGWISGPQSGYPVSLDGGKSTAFIGHGTEYVAAPKAASGGAFVVPFDTPATRRDPSLTGRRMNEAGKMGFGLPGFSMGGLLDFIAKGEGGYNSMNQGTMFGRIVGSTHDAKSKLGKNLTDMSLAEVMGFQRDKKLFAAGRYQIIPSTMSWIVNKMKIPKQSIYNTSLQDKMGEGLIQYKRPYAWNYIKGKHDDERGAMLALAREWASLPHPDTGKSVYGNGNKALHSVEEVRDALNKARGTAGTKTEQEPSRLQKLWEGIKDRFGNKDQVQADPKQTSVNSGTTIDNNAVTEEISTGSGDGNVSVTTGDVAPIEAGSGQNPTDMKPDPPIFIDNKYEPPANDYFRTRYGMMAEANTEPVEMF